MRNENEDGSLTWAGGLVVIGWGIFLVFISWYPNEFGSWAWEHFR